MCGATSTSTTSCWSSSLTDRDSASLILGIDPGSQRTGYAVLLRRGRRLQVQESGVIDLRGGAADLSRRLGKLLIQLETIVARAAPQEIAVEDVFTSHNVRSALALGQARGVVLGVAGKLELPLYSYPPATVKLAVAGHGRADKAQIQRMVQVLLSLTRQPATDEADAMAVAICHALRRATEGAA